MPATKTLKPSIASKTPASKAPVKSAVRNTAIPKAVVAAPAPRKEITREMIAARAFEIYSSGQGGSEFENWVRAERELRAI